MVLVPKTIDKTQQFFLINNHGSVNIMLDPIVKNMHNVKCINNKSFMRTLSHARSDKTLHKNKTRTKILL